MEAIPPLRLLTYKWNEVITQNCRLWEHRLALDFTEEDRLLSEDVWCTV